MTYVISILITVIAVLFAGGSFYVATKERKERKAKEKELEERKKNEQKAAEIITEANETKENASTGDIDNDLNYMAGKLHDFAKK